MISTGEYIAKTKITSSGIIESGSEITFRAGTEIE